LIVVLFLILYIVFSREKYLEVVSEESQQKEIETMEEVVTSQTLIEEEVTLDGAVQEEVMEDEKKTQDDEGASGEKEKKTDTKDSSVLRIGMINDLHIKASQSREVIREKYTEKINYFIEKMNNDFHPDFIVVNGDVIEGTDSDEKFGEIELELTKDLFDEADAEKYWVIGNHDLRAVNKKHWKRALEIGYLNTSFEKKGYGVIILDTNLQIEDGGDDYAGGQLSEEQLDFIDDELGDFDGKAVIFSHYPLFKRKNKESDKYVLIYSELEDIFDDDGDVVAVFSGHREKLLFEEVENVWHYVAPGIIRNSKYEGYFSEITIRGDKLSIDGYYLNDNGKYDRVHLEN